MDPDRQDIEKWTHLTAAIGRTLVRPFYFALCFMAPVWGAFFAVTVNPWQHVLFGGLAVVSFLLGFFGLLGAFERAKEEPVAPPSLGPDMTEWRRLEDKLRR